MGDLRLPAPPRITGPSRAGRLITASSAPRSRGPEHVEGDAGLSRDGQEYLAAPGLTNQVGSLTGDAVPLLREAAGPFDLIIFNDRKKQPYPDSLPVMRAKWRAGGVLIIDSTRWGGRAFDPAEVIALSGRVGTAMRFGDDYPPYVPGSVDAKLPPELHVSQ